MQVGLVVGTATSTVKHSSMQGWKLLVVQFYGTDGQTPDGEPVIAVDHLVRRQGRTGFAVERRPRHAGAVKSDTTPVRWSVMGIQD